MAKTSDPDVTMTAAEREERDRKELDKWNAKAARRGKLTATDIIARARPHEAHEIRAREALGKAIELRRHLEAQVIFWQGKAKEVEAHVLAAISALDKAKADETKARLDVDAALSQDATYRMTKAEELRAKIAELEAQAAKLEADEL